MMNVIFSHDGAREILYPNPSQSVATDFVVFVCPLRVVGDIETHIFAIANIAMANHWISTNATHTNSCANCETIGRFCYFHIDSRQKRAHKAYMWVNDN